MRRSGKGVAPIGRVGRLLALVVAVAVGSGCAAVHTEESVLSRRDLVDVQRLVGYHDISDLVTTAALGSSDAESPFSLVLARLWPARDRRHFIEGYARDRDGEVFPAPMWFRLGRLPDGRSLAEVEGVGAYPGQFGYWIAEPANAVLTLRGHHHSEERITEAAERLRLTVSRNGQVESRDRRQIAALLDALAIDRSAASRPIGEDAFRELADRARRSFVFALETDWRRKPEPVADLGDHEDAGFVKVLDELGEPWARYVLARLHANGMFVPQDRTRARRLAESALADGEERAAALLGSFSRDGIGQPVDLTAARALFERAIVVGETNAMRHLAALEFQRPGGQARGLSLLRLASEAGDPYAAQELGRRHLAGDGVTRDPAAALRYFLTASAAALDFATFNAALLHDRGQGTAEDPKRAAELYSEAADRGHAASQAALGVLLWSGRGVEANRATAVQWFKRAAALGDMLGQEWLAYAYAEGQAIDRSDAAAVRWFREAATAGSRFAQWRLGVHLAEGRGAGRDCPAARRLLEQAASRGEARAERSLVELFAERIGGGNEQVRGCGPAPLAQEQLSPRDRRIIELEEQERLRAGRFHGMWSAASRGATIYRMGAWHFYETTDPLTDARRQHLVGLPEAHRDATFEPFIKFSCTVSGGSPGLTVDMSLGDRSERMTRDARIPSTIIRVRLDAAQPRAMLWEVADDQWIAFRPGPGLVMATDLETAFARLFGINLAELDVQWTDLSLLRSFLSANERVVMQGAVLGGQSQTLVFRLAGIRLLAGLLESRCRPAAG